MQQLLTGQTRLPGFSGKRETMPPSSEIALKVGSGIVRLPVTSVWRSEGDHSSSRVNVGPGEGADDELFIAESTHQGDQGTGELNGRRAILKEDITGNVIHRVVAIDRSSTSRTATSISTFRPSPRELDQAFEHSASGQPAQIRTARRIPLAVIDNQPVQIRSAD